MKKISLATVLSFDAGYFDTAGFLALQGLFTAHVTGNFVTFGAAVVLGTSGIIAKLQPHHRAQNRVFAPGEPEARQSGY
ncbi:DUF1275 family protein, partial [Rhizobium ruizarguesonis]